MKPKNILLFILITLLSFGKSFSQNNGNYTIEGQVYYEEEGEKVPLPNASVLLTDLETGTSTDNDGQFVYKDLQKGQYTLRVSHIGFQTTEVDVALPEMDGETLEVSLKAYGIDADEVQIHGTRERTVADYQPVQKIDREHLEKSPGVGFGEMMDDQPGVSNRSFGGAPSRPIVRGFDGERLSILQDGQMMGDIQETAHDHSLSSDPLAIEEVEVVRGPASLLYGSNALGGVINILTNDIPRAAREGLGGEVNLQGASATRMGRAGVRLTNGWGDNRLQGRLTYQNSDDMETPQGTLPGTWSENIFASTGAFFGGNNIQGGLSFGYSGQNYGIPFFEPELESEDPREFEEDQENVEIDMHHYNLAGELNWFTDGFFEAIELRTNLSHLDQEELEIEDDGEVDLEIFFDQIALSTSLTMRHGQYGRFESGAIGLDLDLRQTDIGGDEAFHPGDKFVEPSIFAFEEFRLADNLFWQGGARMSYYSLETNPDEDNRFPDHNESHDYLNLSASTGLNWGVTDNISTSFQLGRAYRPPTVAELYADGWHEGAVRFEIGNPDLEPEVSHGVDAMVQFDYDAFNAEVTGFYNQIDNYIATVEQDIGCPDRRDDFTIGGPRFGRCVAFESMDAEKFGFEAMVSYALTNRINVYGQGDMVEGQERTDEGDPLPLMPQHTVGGGLNFEGESWMGDASVKQVFSRDEDEIPANEIPSDGYLLPELQLGYKFDASGNQRIILTVENPFNQEYYNHTSRVRRYAEGTGDPATDGQTPLVQRFPEMGRNIQLGYHWDF